jgi:hypothetical protein
MQGYLRLARGAARTDHNWKMVHAERGQLLNEFGSKLRSHSRFRELADPPGQAGGRKRRRRLPQGAGLLQRVYASKRWLQSLTESDPVLKLRDLLLRGSDSLRRGQGCQLGTPLSQRVRLGLHLSKWARARWWLDELRC